MSTAPVISEKLSSASADLNCVCGCTDLVDLGPCREPSIGPRGTDLEAKLNSHFEAGKLFRCRNCHLGLRLPRPDDQSLATLYENLPTSRWRNGLLRGSAQKFLVKQFDGMSNLRILDVGAFDGTFLASLPKSFSKFAIEPSDATSMLEEQGITPLKPFLQAPTAQEEASFDVVTMFDVFEHLTDPLQGMRDLMAYVKPGGKLFVGTGNLDHWSWKMNAGGHWYLDPIQHVVVGSQRHFVWQAKQLNAASFRVRSFGHHVGTLKERISQASTAFYFGVRNKSGWKRLAVRAMHQLPHFRNLSHKELMPYTQELHDHLLAEFVREETAQ